MKDALKRLQNWYLLNCDDEWERLYGCSIRTIGNPGWSLSLDLKETALENMKLEQRYQNPEEEHDWFQFQVVEGKLELHCGPNNLSQAINLFFDEIMPSHLDPSFEYIIYIPLNDASSDDYFSARAICINEETLKIVRFEESHPDLKYQVGDCVKPCLKEISGLKEIVAL